MSTLELKKNLIEKISKIENEDLLNEVNRLIDLETSDDAVYILNSQEEQAISEAEIQIKKGNVLTDEEAKKDIDEWLKK